MHNVSDNPTLLIPFALLLLAVIGLWVNRKLWMSALIASIVAAYATGALTGLAWLWIAVLAGLTLLYRWVRARPPSMGAKVSQAVVAASLFCFAVALGLLVFAGFPRTILIDSTVLSAGSAAFSVGLGFPKVVVGILILGLLNETRVRSGRELLEVLRRTAPVFAIMFLVVLVAAWGLGWVKFAPKWTPLFLVWAPVNLFFTCLSEEAFFRGFVQHDLARIGNRPQVAGTVALIVAALLFGFAHFAGGWTYASLAVVAGLGYGWAYRRTQRIEAAMAVHFALNAAHFLLFTYPNAAN